MIKENKIFSSREFLPHNYSASVCTSIIESQIINEENGDELDKSCTFNLTICNGKHVVWLGNFSSWHQHTLIETKEGLEEYVESLEILIDSIVDYKLKIREYLREKESK